MALSKRKKQESKPERLESEPLLRGGIAAESGGIAAATGIGAALTPVGAAATGVGGAATVSARLCWAEYRRRQGGKSFRQVLKRFRQGRGAARGGQKNSLKANMSVRRASSPVGPMPKIENVQTSPSDYAGAVDVIWPPVTGARPGCEKWGGIPVNKGDFMIPTGYSP